MDPIAIHDATVDKYRKLMAEILQDYDPELRFMTSDWWSAATT